MAVIADEVTVVVKSDVSKAVAGLQKVSDKAETSMRKVGKSASRAGMALTMGLTLPILGIGLALTKSAMDSQASFAKLQANAGMSADQLGDVKEGLYDIAAIMAVDIPTAVDASFTLFSAGITDTNELLEATEMVLMGVNANLGESKDLAGLAAVAYANWGLDTERTLDVLTYAASQAILGPEEMISVFNRTAGTAAAAGVSYDALAASAIILANSTGDASKAGTQLDGLLLKIANVGPLAQSALADIGMDAPEFKQIFADMGIDEGLDYMNEQFTAAGWTTDEWLQKMFPDGQALVGAASILGHEQGTALAEGIEGADGELRSAFQIATDTVMFKLRQMKSKVFLMGEEIALALLEGAGPYLDDMGEKLDELLVAFDEMSTEGKLNVLKLVGAVAAFGPALWIFGKIVSMGGAIAGVFNTLLGPAIAAIAEGGWAVVASWGATAATFLFWVAIIAVVVAAIWYFRDEIMMVIGAVADWLLGIWEGIVAFTTENWSYIEGVIEGAMTLVQSIIEDVIAFVVPLWNDFVGFVRDMTAELVAWWDENWPKIYKIIDFVFKKVTTIIRVALIVLQALWDTFWPAIEMALKVTWETIKLTIRTAWEVISGIFSFWLSILTGDWEGAWNALKGILTGVWDAMKGFIMGVFSAIKFWLITQLNNFKERWGEKWEALKSGAIGVFEGIRNTIKTIFTGVMNWLIDKINWAIGKVNGLIQGFNTVTLFGPDIPKIPTVSNLGFGGTDLSGTFKVGDRGLPELVSLPQGSSVTPLAPGDSGGGGGTTIHFHSPQNDPHGIAREVGWELTKRGL